MKLGTQKGTTNYEEAVKMVGEARVVAFDTFGDAVQALINKDVDGVVIDDTAGVGYVGVNADKIKLLPEKLVGQELGFVFPKGSDLVEPFNAAIAAMQRRRHVGSAGEEVVRWQADSPTMRLPPSSIRRPRPSRKIISFKDRGSVASEPRMFHLWFPIAWIVTAPAGRKSGDERRSPP